MDVKKIENVARISHAFPPIDLFKIPISFPNLLVVEKTSYPLPFSRGHDNDHSARFHVVMFLSHMSELSIHHEDHMLLMFDSSLQEDVAYWIHNGLPNKSITSFAGSLRYF